MPFEDEHHGGMASCDPPLRKELRAAFPGDRSMSRRHVESGAPRGARGQLRRGACSRLTRVSRRRDRLSRDRFSRDRFARKARAWGATRAAARVDRVPKPDSYLLSRRWVLRFTLALALGLAAFPLWSGALRSLSSRLRSDDDDGRVDGSASVLDAGSLAIAALAAERATHLDGGARRIVAEVEASLPSALRQGPVRARAAHARRLLLSRRRIESELARNDVVVLDGWVLARSEAELAIYLHHLQRLQAGSA